MGSIANISRKTREPTMRAYENYTKEDWEKLRGYDWDWLLSTQPKFSIYCDWGKLDGHNWGYLLKHQPQFSYIVECFE